MVPVVIYRCVTVVFATCDHQPLIAPDDAPLAVALGDLGMAVVPIPWTEIDPTGVVDAWPIVLRSTWDYHRVPTMFAAWLAALADSGRVVMNSPAIARDNIDKIYLRGLEEAGIPIPRTRWVGRPDAAALRQALRDEAWEGAVIKPRIAATAYGTFLISPESDLSEADLAPARAAGALLQEFIPEIRTRGEISLVFAGSDFSHAVSKHASDGDYRVQKDFGGSVVETTPSAVVRALASHVMTQVGGDCVFARVDIVEAGRGPLLMELELIEPELYFTLVPGSAARMAQAIAARLS